MMPGFTTIFKDYMWLKLGIILISLIVVIVKTYKDTTKWR
jgi:heme exporter protein D